jgi:acyl-homoserine lactone synthase
MYQRRYDVFVKRRGWSALAREDGIEKDQFDTENAIYLLNIREDGFVDGGLRLLPTTGPHLLSELFPHFVAGDVPRGLGIYEMTRCFTIRDSAQKNRMRYVAGELLCAMFEYCLDNGGEWITTMLDTFYVHRMRDNHWNEVLLGPPTKYDEGTAVAAKFAVTEGNLKATQLAHGVFWRALRDVSPIEENLQNAA